MMAGELRDRADVLELRPTAEGWGWAVVRCISIKVEVTGTGNNFSAVGKGAPGVKLSLRRQALTQHHALDWGGKRILMTSIRTDGGWMEADGAMVLEVQCRADAQSEGGGAQFPAALTEKYVRYAHETPYDTTTTCHVLVTPKAVVLDSGSLVEVNGTPYHVQLGHTLDAYKNEYEIVRECDS